MTSPMACPNIAKMMAHKAHEQRKSGVRLSHLLFYRMIHEMRFITGR